MGGARTEGQAPGKDRGFAEGGEEKSNEGNGGGDSDMVFLVWWGQATFLVGSTKCRLFPDRV